MSSPSTKSNPTISALLSRGSASVLAGQTAVAAASLLATPFTVRLLGPERYGMLLLIGVITNYAGLADLGMGLASTRFAAMAYADRDGQREVAVVWTSALVLILPALLAALAILLTSNLLTAFVHSSTAIAREGASALRLGAVSVILSGLCGIWNTPQIVRLKMSQCSAIACGGAILQSLCTPVVLLAGGGLIGAAGTGVVVLVLTLLLHVMLARHSLPSILTPHLRRDLIRPLVKFGGCAAATTIASRIVAGGERLLLPRFASIATLAHFGIAYAPINVVLLVTNTIHPALLASFARLGSADSGGSSALFRRALVVCGIAVSLLLITGCALAKPFFRIWAGNDYAQHSVVPFYILCGGALFNAMAFAPSALIVSRDRMDLLMRLYYAEIVPYLILTIYLASRAGAVGAAIAWSLRAIVDGTALFFLARYTSPGTEAAGA